MHLGHIGTFDILTPYTFLGILKYIFDVNLTDQLLNGSSCDSLIGVGARGVDSPLSTEPLQGVGDSQRDVDARGVDAPLSVERAARVFAFCPSCDVFFRFERV